MAFRHLFGAKQTGWQWFCCFPNHIPARCLTRRNLSSRSGKHQIHTPVRAQRGLEDYFRFYNGLRPHQALGYRTPAEVFHGGQGVVEGDSKERRCSPEQGTESLAGAPGFSLNSPLILSK